MKKRIILTVLCMILTLLFSVQVQASLADEKSRVFDYADILTDAQESDLQKQLEGLIDDTETDFVIVTVNDTEGKTSQAYADDFFDYNGFGKGAERDGVLFLINMGDRVMNISTSGKAIKKLSDSDIDSAFDSIGKDMKTASYYDAAQTFISEMEINFYKYTVGEVILYIIIALVISLIVCLVIRGSYLKGYKQNQYNYKANTRAEITRTEDTFINKTVTSRRIQNNSSGGSSGGSSTHRSSSGRSHGGGSRGF